MLIQLLLCYAALFIISPILLNIMLTISHCAQYNCIQENFGGKLKFGIVRSR